MEILTSDEKKELRRLVHSSTLRNDCRRMSKKSRERKVTPDEYIRFVDFFNAMINHPLKPFKKITGDNFKL